METRDEQAKELEEEENFNIQQDKENLEGTTLNADNDRKEESDELDDDIDELDLDDKAKLISKEEYDRLIYQNEIKQHNTKIDILRNNKKKPILQPRDMELVKAKYSKIQTESIKQKTQPKKYAEPESLCAFDEDRDGFNVEGVYYPHAGLKIIN